MSAPAHQQRLVTRHSCCRDLEVEYEGHSGEIEVHAPDISPRGMFINTPRVFPEGSVLKVHFRLGQTGETVFTRGEVRYCLPGVGVGVEFIEISDEAQEAIREAACEAFDSG